MKWDKLRRSENVEDNRRYTIHKDGEWTEIRLRDINKPKAKRETPKPKVKKKGNSGGGW